MFPLCSYIHVRVYFGTVTYIHILVYFGCCYIHVGYIFTVVLLHTCTNLQLVESSEIFMYVYLHTCSGM